MAAVTTTDGDASTHSAASAGADTASAHSLRNCGVCKQRPVTAFVDFSCMYQLDEYTWSNSFNHRMWWIEDAREDSGGFAMRMLSMQMCSVCKKAFVEAVLFWLSQSRKQNVDAAAIHGYDGEGPACACCQSTGDIRHLRFTYHDVAEDFSDPCFKMTTRMARRARFKECVPSAQFKGHSTVVHEADPKAKKKELREASLPTCKWHRAMFLRWLGAWIDTASELRINDHRYQ